MTTLETRLLGRAKNVVLKFLADRLIVPKIYLDADWAGERVDVLAIDRDGAGDVHVVLMAGVDLPEFPEVVDVPTEDVQPLLNKLHSLPGQYKYIALIDRDGSGRSPLSGLTHSVSESSFAPDGIGRIGFVSVYFAGNNEEKIQLVFKPERFRAKIAKLADEYVQQHEADWEIRA